MLLRPVSSVVSSRIRKKFIEPLDGSRQIFTSPVKFIASGDHAEIVYYNGGALTPGPACDYVVTESGGVGTGFDTVTFNHVTPILKDNLFMLIMPSGL